jgi:hypothetical protein
VAFAEPNLEATMEGSPSKVALQGPNNGEIVKSHSLKHFLR